MNRWTSGTLGTTEHVLVSCKGNQTAHIEKIFISNISSGASNYSIFHVPKGQSSGTGDALAYQTNISSKRVTQYEGPIYLLPGDELRVVAGGTAAINMFAYGRST